jgi:flotillin
LQTEAVGEAEAIRLRGEAQADAARALGIAEAEVIRQKGLAEADAARQKAEAWKEFTEAAILQQLLEKLPEVASAVAQPLSKTDRIVVISNGQNGSGTGASKVSQDVADIVAQVPATVEALTGFDLLEAIGNLAGLKSSSAGDLLAEMQTGDGREMEQE